MDLPPLPADIVVTGRALEAPSLPLSQRVLEGTGLATASGRIEEALARVPGLSLFRRASSASASPTAQGVTLRGLGGNAASRAALTLDGVPQTDLFAGWVATAALDAAPVATVAVTRGGGSVTEGPGAIAGAVRMSSALAETRAGARGGSRDSLDLSAGLGLPVAGAFGLSGRFRRSDGFLLVDPALAGPIDVPARYRQWAVRGRAVAAAGPATEVQAGLAAFDDQRLRGIEGAETGTSGGDLSLRIVHRGALPAELMVYGQLRDFTARNYAINRARTLATLTLDQFATPATGWGGRVELRPRPWLSLGGDWRQATGETRERFRYVAGTATALRVAGGRSKTAGGFAEVDLRPVGDLRLTAGFRVDGWQLSDGGLRETDILTGAPIRNEPAPDRRGHEFSWRAGASTPIPGAEALTLRLAGYSGWRLPTLNELYRPFRAGQDATAANPLLAPERLVGIDGGVDVEPLPALRLSLTGFHNRLENGIANVTLAQGPGVFPGVGFVAGSYRRRANLEAITSTGLEADGALTVGSLALTLGYAFADARVAGGVLAPALAGKRPAQAPRHWVSASLRHARGPFSAALDLRHEGMRFEDDLNQRSLAAATVIDLGLSFRINPRLSLGFDASNLANAIVETGFSGNLVERAEPRTLMVSLQLAR